MAFAKKTWKDRITEFPTRRTLTKSDGSTELVTVARAEGTVSQEGDAFNAASMNDLEERISQANNDLNESLTANNTQFVFDYQDGKYGFNTDPNRGADSFHPFKHNSGALKFVKITSVTNNYYTATTDVKSVLPEKYSELTHDNFFFKNMHVIAWNSGGAASNLQSEITYNPSDGTLKITSPSRVTGGSGSTFSALGDYEIWCVYIDE